MKNFYRDHLQEAMRRNGNLLTGFLVVLILFVGVSINSGVSQWWYPLMALALFLAAIFLFINARVVIKAAVSSFLVLLEALLAFKFGVAVAPESSASSTWLLLVLLSFTGFLTISYAKPAGESRWGAAFLGTTSGFLASFVLAALGVNLLASSLLGLLLATVLFLIKYYFGRQSRGGRSFPMASLSDELASKLSQAALAHGWGAHFLTRGPRRLLLWNDDRGYLLTAVALDQRLGMDQRDRLTYKGKAVNGWLLSLVYSLPPLRHTRGAPLLPVLLDVNNGNGSTPRVMGVDLPDSRRQAPVALLPAQKLLDKPEKLLAALEAHYGSFAQELTPRQLIALSYYLPEADAPGEVSGSSSTKASTQAEAALGTMAQPDSPATKDEN